MSSVALAWAWSQTEINNGQKFLLLAMAEHANHIHVCWPSVKRLAKMTNTDERTVRRQLSALSEAGLISIVPWSDQETGRYTTNRYKLKVESPTVDILSPLEDEDAPALDKMPGLESNNSTTSRNNSSYSVRSIARRKAASIEDELDPEKAVWGNEGGADAPEPRPKAGRKNLRTRAISAGGNLARDFAARARKARPGMPGETNQGALSGQFNRWMKQDDLDANVIRGMMDTYFGDERLWDSNRPMWVDFLNKRARLATAGQREADLREAQDNRLNPDYWTEVEQVEHDASYWESV